MKTIQQYLKEVDKQQLINEYFYTYPINLNDIKNIDADASVLEIIARRRKRIEKYIDRLINLKINQPKDEDNCLVFAYKVFKDDWKDTDYAIVEVKEVLEKEINEDTYINNYGCMFTEQEEILAYLIADNALTQNNIYGLLSYILYEASWFGFENEYLEEEKQKLDNAFKEIEEGDLKEFSLEDLKKELQIDTIIDEDITEGMEEKEEELTRNIIREISKFNICMFTEELRKIKKKI